MGVREVRSPTGEVWWVKRAWVPRYRGLRDRVGAYLEERPRRWYQAPLRFYTRGYDRWVLDVPDPTAVLPWEPVPGAGAAPPVAQPWGAAAPDGTTVVDPGGGADAGDGIELAAAGGALGDLGGGGDPSFLAASPADAGSLVDTGGGTPGDGGDLDLDPGDLGVVVLVVIAALALVAVSWFVLLPLVLLVVDGAVLLLAILAAGVVRVALGRPWDVVAAHDRSDGRQAVRRWELRGYRRAGRARDDVARALETGTDADLAVARVVAREPRSDDPAGIARSVREVHER
jgi:hypothetical protein